MCRQLPDLDLRVVLDPDPAGSPNPLRTARLAWGTIATGSTHHLVLQDDVVLVPGFVSQLRDLVASNPEGALSLFAEWGARSASAVRVAAMHRCTFAHVVDNYLPTQALVLPVEAAAEFVRYVDTEATEKEHDDMALHAFARATGITTLVSVTNLVDHLDMPSIVGHDLSGPRRSVCLAVRAELPSPTGSVLPDPSWTPYFSWWKLTAMASVPDASTPTGRVEVPLAQILAAEGISWPEVCARLPSAIADLPQQEIVREQISGIVLAELWTTAYALGWTAAGALPDAKRPNTHAPTARAAVATMPAGALRRVIPEHRLAAIGAALEPLMHAGIHAGLSDYSCVSA